jgi:DNA invertase Pin-like site-specific DNA recombinase
VRIAGYVRESADDAADRPAFAQHEELRRYAAEHGHDLVAVCRDARAPGHALGRTGYRSLLGVIAAGGIDAVLLPGVATLSSDQIVQEIILWDLRSRRVRVLSTLTEDAAVLGGDPGPARMVIRDVLARVAEYSALASAVPVEPDATPPPAPGSADVVIHLREPETESAGDEHEVAGDSEAGTG